MDIEYVGSICRDMDHIQFRMLGYQKRSEGEGERMVSQNPMKFCLCCEWELME